MTTVIPLRARPDLCSFFAEQFEAEWPTWYGPGRRGDAAADLTAFANAAGGLPVGVVALDDSGSPVGIAALKATSIDTYTHVGPWATAGYVLPERRRAGIGASLLSALLAEARRLGFDMIYCATASAVSLLEREGWSRIDAVNHEGGTQFIFSRAVPPAANSSKDRETFTMTKATAPDGSVHHSLIPVLVVADADAAVDFYLKAFDGREVVRIPGPSGKTAHGQVRIGDTILFVALEPDNRDTYLSPTVLGGTTTAVYTYWEDCDASFRKAVEAGAEAIDEPADLPWGDRVGLVRDPFGHLWSIASRNRDTGA